jgi:hypothetical protein
MKRINGVVLALALVAVLFDCGRARASIVLHGIRTASTQSASLTVQMVAGTEAGDLLIAAIFVNEDGFGNPSIAAPPGWTERTAPVQNGTMGLGAVGIYTKIAGAAEPSSYTFTITSGAGDSAWSTECELGAYGGANTATPIDAIAQQQNAYSTTASAPSVSVPAGHDSDELVAAFALGKPGTNPSAPTGMMREDLFDNPTDGVATVWFDQTLNASAATSIRISQLALSTHSIGTAIAIAPAVVLSTTPTPAATPRTTPKPTTIPTPAPTAAPTSTLKPTAKPTLAATAAPTNASKPTPTKTPKPTATPTPVSGYVAHFYTLAAHATLPSGANCAAEIAPSTWEPRPDNTTANNTVVTASQLSIFHAQPLYSGSSPASDYATVDGNYTATTDMIIRWSSCKWGFDEDVVRAQVANESWWHQNSVGDWTTDQSLCSTNLWNGWTGSGCYLAYGLLQAHANEWSAWPEMQTSSAFNLDMVGAYRRACMNGDISYLVGQLNPATGNAYPNSNTNEMLWGCIGQWYSGAWYDSGANTYISHVQSYLASKPWLNSGF